MNKTICILIVILGSLAATISNAQTPRDDFNRAATTDLAGSLKWRRVLDLTDTAASIQINGDSTISPYNPDGLYSRGAVYWDSALTVPFEVGIVLKHKSGSTGIPSFYLQVMDDSSWYTGNGYGFRFQENSGQDRMDIQRITGSGVDTPSVSLMANMNREFLEGDTLFFRFYADGRKTGVYHSAGGARDSITTTNTTFNPSSWYVWLQGAVFTDPIRMDDFMVGVIPWYITATAGPNGSISPSGAVPVNDGATQAFTIAPDPGCHLDSVVVDGTAVDSTTGYTFTNVDSDHTIAAYFSPDTHTITATAGPNGTITPSGGVVVVHGGSQGFSIVPHVGYHIDSVLVDDVRVDSTASYTFTAVTANHSIGAFFSIDTYTITAAASDGGGILPSGAVSVNHGENRLFTITPDPGHHIDSVVVDGTDQGAVANYEFTAVTDNHTIDAYFSVDGYTIIATASPGGSITPSDTVPAVTGSNVTFTMVPDPGFRVDSVIVDGSFAGADTTYTFETISASHTIHVVFVRSSFSYDVMNDWNLVSVPQHTPDPRAFMVFPQATAPAYRYEGAYIGSDTIEHGVGYWLKVEGDQSVVIDGPPVPADTIVMLPGWNLLGSVSEPVSVDAIGQDPPGNAITGFYGYSGGYSIADSIRPGKAYWVKTAAPGSMVLDGNTTVSAPGKSALRKSAGELASFNRIIFAPGNRKTGDGSGEQELCFGPAGGGEIQLGRYEMPPLPPAGLFDVRFSSQRSVETVSATGSEGVEIPVRIQSPTGAVDISWSMNTEDRMKYAFVGRRGTGVVFHIELAGDGSASVLLGGDVEYAVVSDGLPVAYALGQNYPNPFNPLTIIPFDLPEPSVVTMKVYNILGVEVMELATGRRFGAGSHRQQADFSGISSGIYFYKLTARGEYGGRFDMVRKMVVLK